MASINHSYLTFDDVTHTHVSIRGIIGGGRWRPAAPYSLISLRIDSLVTAVCASRCCCSDLKG